MYLSLFTSGVHMTSSVAEFTSHWAGQLADVADHVASQIPDSEEWGTLRHFLSNTARLLRKGEVKAGFRTVVKILPYLQRAVSSVEKCHNVNSTFDVTETVSRNFLVDPAHRENIDNFLQTIQRKVSQLRVRVEALAREMDTVLNGVIEKGVSPSWWMGVRTGFEINRISALIRSAEDDLRQARDMLDELNSHVASKSLLAYLVMYVSFMAGLAFSAAGNVGIGATLISVATATRTAAKSLESYRSDLQQSDVKHRQLQSELTEWKHKFEAEQRNFLLLYGPLRSPVILSAVFLFLYVIGQTGNAAIFVVVTSVLVARATVTEWPRFGVGLWLAVAAVWFEYKGGFSGLLVFNFGSAVLAMANYLGLVDFWW